MTEQYLYEYAVIRVVPRVEREEFLNTGVVLFCAQQKFLDMRFHIDEQRFQILSEQPVNINELAQHLHTFECICKGLKCGSPIADLDTPSRFRWLTATRSTILQCSKVHPGFSTAPAETLNQLFKQMVL